MQLIKLFHLILGSKFATTRGIHSNAYSNSFVVGKSINAGAARLNLARRLNKLFLISGIPSFLTGLTIA